MNTPSDSRRRFIGGVAGIAGAISIVPAASITANAQAMPGTATAASGSALPAAYQSLGPAEAAFVEAMVNVMCPADSLTPSGVDCGLALFFDRQLAGGFGKGDHYYAHGPWSAGKPELGIQSPLTPEQYFKAGLHAASDACKRERARAFEELSAEDANAFLLDIAAGKVSDARVPLGQWFNDLVYPLFTQACFADPMYGGNRDKVFWKMVGYPGLPATHAEDMTLYRGKPFPAAAKPQSIVDFS
jgi:gluconate 2-dehydrogenase gamma chain